VNFVLFYHSFSSCWNHGNAHFLRGIARKLVELGHHVTVYEQENGWSRTNALRDGGARALDEASSLVPGIVRSYRVETLDLDRVLDDADVVIVHEWNDPILIAALSRRRLHGGRFVLLFHDTHHRAVTTPHQIERFELGGFDAVLAFGEVLREVYRRRGWAQNVFTWHEAADTDLFQPCSGPKEVDVIWIGNWGDDERSSELNTFLLEPVSRLRIKACVHGVRYPKHARQALAQNGITYRGWLPNHRAPAAFGRARLTVHIPRRPYVNALPGIPTIRMFEALACGTPLISSPWQDIEGLFPEDSYLRVDTGDEMVLAIERILRSPEFADHLSRKGLAAIRARHTCGHRVRELLEIVQAIKEPKQKTRYRTRQQEWMSAP
jgi:spore maturation protein CgeB